jgi:hypothetical protein
MREERGEAHSYASRKRLARGRRDKEANTRKGKYKKGSSGRLGHR